MNVNVFFSFSISYNTYQKLGALNLMAFKSLPLRNSKKSTYVWKTYYTCIGNRPKGKNMEEKDRDREENREKEK